MGASAGATQAAVIARYRGDTILQGILTTANSVIVAPEWNILDGGAIRTGQKFPYVEVMSITSRIGDALAMDYDANDPYLMVTAFSRYGGMKQARDIMARIYALTHMPAGAAPFVLGGGFTNWLTLFENEVEQSIDHGDGITEQITHRFHFGNIG